jgi:bifunctional ADP-heptose synthase (sugar kinase/adenylyltransferase)
VLVKGGSRPIDDVEGADLMRAWGGRVTLIELVPDHPPALTPLKG